MVATPISMHLERAGFKKEAVAFTAETTFTDIHLSRSPDLSGLEQVRVEDGRITARHNERGGVSKEGTFNGDVEAGVYLTGKNEITADTVQVAESDLMILLGLMFGAVDRQNATTAKVAGAHNSTSVELNSSTNYAVGGIIGVTDADGSEPTIVKPGGRIIDITGDIATFEKDIGFTIADGDKVVGCATAYIVPSTLAGRAGANHLATWRFEKGLDNESVVQLVGCAMQPGLQGLNENENLELVFQVMASLVQNSGRDSLTASLAGAISGDAPLVMGPRTKFLLQDYGTKTETPALHPSGVALDPGLEVVRGKVSTSQVNNAQGQWGYSTNKARPTMEFTLTPHDADYDIDQKAGTFKVCGYWREGTEGRGIYFSMPRAELIVTPKLGTANEVLVHQMSILGHEDVDGIGTTDLAKSPFVIGLL